MTASETLRPPPRRRPRRSHAERTAETRARIQEALVGAITEVGFQRATSAEISRRAGVSWGAAQHHFGDKNGILMAVLVDSFNRLVAELEGLPAEGASLEERVDAFVEGAWRHVGSPHYRCTFEILLNLSASDWQAEGESLLPRTLGIWNDIWDRFFAAPHPERHRRLALQYYVIATLSGLAAFRKFEGPNPEQHRLELGFLKETLRRELRD
jgi:AcrR family transcriptional regulator